MWLYGDHRLVLYCQDQNLSQSRHFDSQSCNRWLHLVFVFVNRVVDVDSECSYTGRFVLYIESTGSVYSYGEFNLDMCDLIQRVNVCKEEEVELERWREGMGRLSVVLLFGSVVVGSSRCHIGGSKAIHNQCEFRLWCKVRAIGSLVWNCIDPNITS